MCNLPVGAEHLAVMNGQTAGQEAAASRTAPVEDIVVFEDDPLLRQGRDVRGDVQPPRVVEAGVEVAEVVLQDHPQVWGG